MRSGWTESHYHRPAARTVQNTTGKGHELNATLTEPPRRCQPFSPLLEKRAFHSFRFCISKQKYEKQHLRIRLPLPFVSEMGSNVCIPLFYAGLLFSVATHPETAKPLDEGETRSRSIEANQAKAL
jgi:predicted mannosyl-3-phosphoglycerate phosphatase (HAD superfamily)